MIITKNLKLDELFFKFYYILINMWHYFLFKVMLFNKDGIFHVSVMKNNSGFFILPPSFRRVIFT